MISTADDARAAVRSARFPPAGNRGGGGIAPHLAFGMTSHVEYIARANAETLVAVQIETAEGVANIDEIVAVDGIDLVFIGPFDLHLSLGLPPALWSDDPRFLLCVDRVIAACTSRGMPLGTLSPDSAGAGKRLLQGFRFVGLGSDLNHMLAALRAQRGAFPMRKPS
jgi:4-hydroxy-2-oxoheptanedioate aldolase